MDKGTIKNCCFDGLNGRKPYGQRVSKSCCKSCCCCSLRVVAKVVVVVVPLFKMAGKVFPSHFENKGTTTTTTFATTIKNNNNNFYNNPLKPFARKAFEPLKAVKTTTF